MSDNKFVKVKGKDSKLFSMILKYALPSYKVSPVWAIASVALAFIFILQIVLSVDSIRRYNNEFFYNKNLENKISENTEILATGMEEDNTNYIEKMFKILLTSGRLLTLERSYWSYELKVNGADITNNAITVKPGKLEITFIETEKPRILPLRMHLTGSLTAGDATDPYYTHIAILSDAQYTTEHKTSADGKRTAVFTFNNLTAGQNITLSPTPILEERAAGAAAKSTTITVQ